MGHAQVVSHVLDNDPARAEEEALADVKRMDRGKAPRLDGDTVQVVRETWPRHNLSMHLLQRHARLCCEQDSFTLPAVDHCSSTDPSTSNIYQSILASPDDREPGVEPSNVPAQ
jgi:hypothetical protein